MSEKNIQMLLGEFAMRFIVIEKVNMRKLKDDDFIWIYHYEKDLTREYIRLRKTTRNTEALQTFILAEYEYLLRNE